MEMQVNKTIPKYLRPIVLTLIVTVASCSSSGVSGKYINSENPNDYYELKADGTWYAQLPGGRGASGTYEVTGKDVTLKMPNGLAAKVTIDGTTMSDPDRGKKVYQKAN
jgi:hypothetical protein